MLDEDMGVGSEDRDFCEADEDGAGYGLIADVFVIRWIDIYNIKKIT